MNSFLVTLIVPTYLMIELELAPIMIEIIQCIVQYIKQNKL